MKDINKGWFCVYTGSDSERSDLEPKTCIAMFKHVDHAIDFADYRRYAHIEYHVFEPLSNEQIDEIKELPTIHYEIVGSSSTIYYTAYCVDTQHNVAINSMLQNLMYEIVAYHEKNFPKRPMKINQSEAFRIK